MRRRGTLEWREEVRVMGTTSLEWTARALVVPGKVSR